MASKKKKRPTPPPPPVRSAPPRAKGPSGPTTRQLEREAAARQAKKEAVRRRLVTGGVVVAGLAAVGAYLVVDRRGDQELEQFLTAGSCTVDGRTDPTSSPPNNHVPNPTYGVNPPAGGNHLGTGAATAGAYEGQRVPADGLVVHSLEHGYVVVWHQPGLDAPTREALVELQERNSPDVLLVERPSLPVTVAATAWGERLLCGQSEPAVLQRFVDEHVGNGPEDVDRQ